MKPLVLFDVDGTLLLTGGAGMRAMTHVARELFGESFSWDGIEVSGHLDTLIFNEAAERNRIPNPEAHHRRFRLAYLERLARELATAEIREMPGVRRAVEALRDRRDVTVGLLTGNYTEAIPLKLAAIDFDPAWFEITAFADDGPTRADLVEVAIAKHAARLREPADPARVIIVGDTPRDIACGKAHGCVTFSVATGKFDVEALRAAGADHAVNDLGDPGPLLAVVDRLLAA